VVTTSLDGHLKLWKKQEQGIEFVKHYRTSLKAIVGISASDDGKLVATVSEGGEGRVFDVVNFGGLHLLLLVRGALTVDRYDQHPKIPIHPQSLLLGARAGSRTDVAGGIGCWLDCDPDIRWTRGWTALVRAGQAPSIARPSYGGEHPLARTNTRYSQTVQYSSRYDCVVSADEEGFVEYWQPSEPWGLPTLPGLWQYKSSTDLYHFKKVK